MAYWIVSTSSGTGSRVWFFVYWTRRIALQLGRKRLNDNNGSMSICSNLNRGQTPSLLSILFYFYLSLDSRLSLDSLSSICGISNLGHCCTSTACTASLSCPFVISFFFLVSFLSLIRSYSTLLLLVTFNCYFPLHLHSYCFISFFFSFFPTSLWMEISLTHSFIYQIKTFTLYIRMSLWKIITSSLALRTPQHNTNWGMESVPHRTALKQSTPILLSTLSQNNI